MLEMLANHHFCCLFRLREFSFRFFSFPSRKTKLIGICTQNYESRLPSRYPYNWRKPIGYFFTMIVTTLKFYNMGTLYLCVLCIMVGFGEFLIAFAADFEHTLNVIDADLLQYGISSGPLTDANRMRIKLMFRNLVKFHCDFRQLCDDFIAMIDSVFHILF